MQMHLKYQSDPSLVAFVFTYQAVSGIGVILTQMSAQMYKSCCKYLNLDLD